MFRRRPRIFPFIIFIFAFGVVGDIIGGLFGLLELIMPIAVMGIIATAIYNAVNGTNSTTTTRRRTSTTSRRTNTTTVVNANQRRIDEALAEYFAHNDRMMITDNIYFANKNNEFISADKMVIYYYDEEICSLKEFSARYPDVYTEINILLNKFAKKGYKPQTAVKEEPKKQTAPKVTANKKPQSEADVFIEKINDLNMNIPNVDITNGLNQTCDLLRRIDLVDREDGKHDERLNKLYEYYLPILTQILEDYKRLNNSAIKGEEFKKCETQLIKTLNLINQALVTIAESMHDSDYMNLNADISTLQSLLKKDGYSQSPFKEKNND